MLSNSQKIELFSFGKDALDVGRNFSLGPEILTPVNFAEEKKKFFSKNTYNPQFIYLYEKRPDINIPLLELRHRLNKLEIPDDIKVFLHEYLNDLKVHELAIRSVGTIDFSYFAQKLFDWDIESLETVEKRLPKVRFFEEKKPRIYNAEEMGEVFKDYMENKLGLTDFVVHIDAFNDHTIWVGENRLCIGRSIKRNSNNLKRLIVHELESHILQRSNILTSNNPLLRLSKLYENRLYAEGLAVYNEFLTKTLTENAYETYWLRLKAVTMLQYSFRDIFEELSRYTGVDKAFMITYRVKRGMGDTASPGGFPKDASYLYGFEKVYKFVKEGGDLAFLYLVRVPETGNLLKKHGLLSSYKYRLPSFVKSKQSSPQAATTA